MVDKYRKKGYYNKKLESLKEMYMKKFWLGIIVMVLVFGMLIIGCDNGTTSNENNSGNNEYSSGNINTLFLGQWAAGGNVWNRLTISNNNYIFEARNTIPGEFSIRSSGNYAIVSDTIKFIENGRDVGMASITGNQLIGNINLYSNNNWSNVSFTFIRILWD